MQVADAVTLAFLALVTGVFAGYYAGLCIANYGWRWNASVSTRVKYAGRYFKVIDIGDEHSWSMAEIYKPLNMRENYERR